MTKSYKDYIAKIDVANYTFCGVLDTYIDENKTKWAKSTLDLYIREYDNNILPILIKDESKKIEKYTKKDYEKAIAEIKEKGKKNSSKCNRNYSEATLQRFRSLIGRVAKYAEELGICENPLWGSKYMLSPEESLDALVRKSIKIKKSFSIQEEKAIVDKMLNNYNQSGEVMGLLLMFALGLRNGEACAADFGDIIKTPEKKIDILIVYKSTKIKSNETKASGKTKNADRMIAIPSKLLCLIKSRQRNLEKTYGEAVDKLPIACYKDNYEKRCSADQLSISARQVFKDIDLNEKKLAYIDEEIYRESTFSVEEKEPTAYLFRRNFATHLYLLGLTESEIEYVIGHDIENQYESRNEFINEDKLFEIQKKMAKRPLLNRTEIIDNKIVINDTNRKVLFSADFSKTVEWDLADGPISLNIKANEPGAEIKVRVEADRNNEYIEKIVNTYETEVKVERTVNIIEEYQNRYKKN